MKKSEIENYLRKKISLANRPTHEDVRNALKFAYNLGAKKYKSEVKQLNRIMSGQHSTNKAVATLIVGMDSKIKEKDKEIEQLKWLMGKSATALMSLTANKNIKSKIEALAQSYIGMNPKDKGCKNWNEMQKKFTKEILNIVNKK